MANQEHLDLLIGQGVEVWNQWRQENPDLEPDLSGAILNRMNLSGALLSGANLSRADFSGADLKATLLSGAKLSFTIFGRVDLSTVRGLETVQHLGPSIIDIGTIYLSRGTLPEAFLRGAGVPDSFIDAQRSL